MLSGELSNPCPSCANVVERHDVPHVIRTCPGCGREMHIYEPGEHGRGLLVRPGDRPTIPAGFLKFSLNPLKSSGHLTKAGIHKLAQISFLSGLPRQEDGYIEFATSVEKEMDAIASVFLAGRGLDLNDPNQSDQIASVIQEDQTLGGHPKAAICGQAKPAI